MSARLTKKKQISACPLASSQIRLYHHSMPLSVLFGGAWEDVPLLAELTSTLWNEQVEMPSIEVLLAAELVTNIFAAVLLPCCRRAWEGHHEASLIIAATVILVNSSSSVARSPLGVPITMTALSNAAVSGKSAVALNCMSVCVMLAMLIGPGTISRIVVQPVGASIA